MPIEPVVLGGGAATLFCGDCLAVLPKWGTERFAAVVTNPPYGIGYQSARRTDPKARFRKIEGDGSPFIWFLYDAFRLLKYGGCAAVFCRFDVTHTWQVAMEAAGFGVKQQLIWGRLVHGMGDLRGSFSPRHDSILFGTKGRWLVPGTRRADVMPFARVSANNLQHPTEKPLPLMEHLVLSVAPAGGRIIDPLMGSGSTGVAAVRNGYPFVGVEKDPEYFAIAAKRIEEALAQTQNQKESA